MLAKLTQIFDDGTTGTEGRKYKLKEVLVNPDCVIFVEDNETLNDLFWRSLKEGKASLEMFPPGFHEKTVFTTIMLKAGQHPKQMFIVGSKEMVEKNLFGKKLLKD